MAETLIQLEAEEFSPNPFQAIVRHFKAHDRDLYEHATRCGGDIFAKTGDLNAARAAQSKELLRYQPRGWRLPGIYR